MEGRISDLIKKGRDYYNKGQYDIALEIFNEVLNIYPNNISALNKLGNIYFELNNLTEALDIYNNLRSICKRFEFLDKERCALEIIGRIYTLLSKYSFAVNIYLEALAIYDKLESPGGKPKEGKLLLLSKISDLFYRQKNYEQTITTYKALLELHSQFGPLEGIADDLTDIGRVLYKQEKYSEALNKLNEAIQIYKGEESLSKMVIAQFEMGRIYYKSNKYSEAIPYLEDSMNMYKKLGLDDPDDYYYKKTKRMLDDIEEKEDQ